MVFPLVVVICLAEGVGNAPTSAMPILFSGQVQPAYICLPSVKWSGWQELHLRPPRSEQGRLLLTLHPGIGCQTWTRTKTSGLTDRRATLTPSGIGAAGRISTCIVPLRRRMPHVFDHGSFEIGPPRRSSESEDWSARQELHLRSPGSKPGMLLLHHALFGPMEFRDRGRENRDAETLGNGLAVRFKIGGPGGICTLNSPADNGALR
jgi:hypothetical protein